MPEQIIRNKVAFLREIGKELEQDNVAIFAGSGLSAPAGFVSWVELLRPIAKDIGLDVDKEHDRDFGSVPPQRECLKQKPTQHKID